MKKILLLTFVSLVSILSYAQDDTTGCELIANFTYTVSGGNLYLTNTSTGEPAMPFYDWTVDGLYSGLENTTFSTADFEASEEVCLTVFDTLADCSDTYCMTIYFEDDNTECDLVANFTGEVSGGMLNLTNTSTGESASSYYSWSVDGLSSTDENPSFPTGDFEESELVCLIVYDTAYDCVDTVCYTFFFTDDSTEIDSVASIISNELVEVDIYPNPATNVLNVKFNISTSANTQIAIYNSVGVLARKEMISVNTTQLAIDIYTLPTGFYIVHILNEDNEARSVQQKFIKE